MIFGTFNYVKTKYLVCRYYKDYAITTQKSFMIKNPDLQGYSIPAANGGDPPSQIQLHPFTAHPFMRERIYSRNTDEQRRRADANWEDPRMKTASEWVDFPQIHASSVKIDDPVSGLHA